MTASRRVYALTLGCDKNLVDSEALLGRFAARGVEPVDAPDDADILVINTCGFIAAARADSHEAIETFCRHKEERTLVVTGCLAQEHGAEIAARYPEVDLINGVGNFERLLDALDAREDMVPTGRPDDARYEGLADRPLLTPPHLAFVKISEGCNFRCAFCRIPLIRGDQRSRPVSEIVAEARSLAERGVSELMLVSQNTSDYGRGTGEDLLDLVTGLDGIDGLRRVRLHYLYPGLIAPDRFRRLLDTPGVAPYVDMPVQHASPRILRAMNRPFDAEALADFFLDLRARDPEVTLRTTLLLGFPGEEEADVELAADFLERIRFDHVGTYRYSPEDGTRGAGLTDVPDPEEVADRESRLLDLQHDIALERSRRRLGRDDLFVVDAIDDLDDWADLAADLVASEDTEPTDAGGRMLSSERVAVARGAHQAHDVDGVTLMPADGLRAGQWIRARTVAVTPYDGLADPAAAD